jgi:hypothetical protein
MLDLGVVMGWAARTRKTGPKTKAAKIRKPAWWADACRECQIAYAARFGIRPGTCLCGLSTSFCGECDYICPTYACGDRCEERAASYLVPAAEMAH